MIIETLEDSKLGLESSPEVLPGYVTEISKPGVIEPPSYYQKRLLQPMTYTFTGWTSDSMLLMPPPTTNNMNPLYRISVALNLSPFAPLSYVTTVQRGGNMQGQLVGSFELSINQRVAILTMGDSTTRLKNVMWNIGGVDRVWGWSCGSVDLRWDCRSTLDDGSPMCVCYDGISNSDLQLASFVPPPIDASPPLPPAQLTVFPDGHQHLDHILLSALIVERRRSLLLLQ